MPLKKTDPAYTAVRLCDFAAVPVRGAAGAGIALGEWMNGSQGWTSYRHVLGYAGWYEKPPGAWDPRYVSFTGAGDSAIVTGTGHYVFEAQPGGARFRLLPGRPEEIPGSLWSTGKVKVTPAERAAMSPRLIALQGTPYSAADYLALAAHRLRLHPLDNALKDYVKNSAHMICSQLWDYIYAQAGNHLFADGRWPGYVTPWDIAQLLAGAEGMTARALLTALRSPVPVSP